MARDHKGVVGQVEESVAYAVDELALVAPGKIGAPYASLEKGIAHYHKVALRAV